MNSTSQERTSEKLRNVVTELSFKPVTWQDGGEPPINAANLNRIEAALVDLLGTTEAGGAVQEIGSYVVVLETNLNDLSKSTETEINKINASTAKLDDLNIEVEARKTGDTDLDEKINKLKKDTKAEFIRVQLATANSISNVQEDLIEEETSRKNSDNSLQQQLNKLSGDLSELRNTLLILDANWAWTD